MNKRLIALFGALMMLPVGVSEASAVNTDKSIMQNDYLTLYVDQDSDPGRFQLSANQGNLDLSGDDGQNLMYENFYSSYTTVAVNGKAYRFGSGKTVQAPCYDKEQNVCVTVQAFGGVEVTQTLSFADGMATGHEDMLKITYTAHNTEAEETLFGMRIMLDSQLGKDDLGILTVDGAVLDFEKEYKDAVPEQWSITAEDGSITAYGKVLTVPDSIVFADWSSLFDKKWQYRPDASKDIQDSAAALVWHNSTLSAGEERVFSVYYGVKNRAGDVPPEESSQPPVSSAPSEESSQPSAVSAPSEDSAQPSAASATPEDSTQPSAASSAAVSAPDKGAVGTGESPAMLLGIAGTSLLSLSAIGLLKRNRRKGGSRHA